MFLLVSEFKTIRVLLNVVRIQVQKIRILECDKDVCRVSPFHFNNYDFMNKATSSFTYNLGVLFHFLLICCVILCFNFYILVVFRCT